MKVAPLFRALRREAWCTPLLIHTGQHYDDDMSTLFFRDLGLPQPYRHLGVGSGSHAEQTAGVMVACEQVCQEQRPDWVIVVGDVNSTLAGALSAKKLQIPVAHLEAGLRSRDMSMPEEINRLLTDAISDLLWTPSPDADENLKREGIPPERIVRVGNIMIDSYEMLREQIEAEPTAFSLGLEPGNYGVVTLHRPNNVDCQKDLSGLVAMLIRLAAMVDLVFPVHPRTRARLESFGFWGVLEKTPGLQILPPMSYIRFMSLVREARLVITDSGGLQEETTFLNIPCLTLRENTERPITITQGTNRLVNPESIVDCVQRILDGLWVASGMRPQFWDGNTAARVVKSLKEVVLG
ncbi:MAG: UDP-N-acetylglucosamine 2-epimerase (non-hydrolyzing) [Deltaproteobacteria bacterium]|nr:MAG: UDP-N-acetylglucosamine 2-epimerase (non-hydrolyzing) [Deltaproteobacteria bacterium]